MELTIIAFGIARDILGGKEITYQLTPPFTVRHLLDSLQTDYPKIEGLASIKVAINSQYVGDENTISSDDEIVLIPPVSGG